MYEYSVGLTPCVCRVDLENPLKLEASSRKCTVGVLPPASSSPLADIACDEFQKEE